MKLEELAEAFDGEEPSDEGGAEPEEADEEEDTDKAVSADADVFFDDTEDRATRLEALRRLVRKLK